jgi:UPF0716 family protein affecting phage T7 exclusion
MTFFASMELLTTQATGMFIDSPLYRGTVLTGQLLILAFLVILLLFCITVLVRIFIKRHPLITRAHKILLYLLTMSGVLILFLGAIIGAMLPIIPGFLFLFLGVLLMRKYHKWTWIEGKFTRARNQFRKTGLGKRFYAWRQRMHKEHEARVRERKRLRMERELQREEEREQRRALREFLAREKVNKERRARKR